MNMIMMMMPFLHRKIMVRMKMMIMNMIINLQAMMPLPDVKMVIMMLMIYNGDATFSSVIFVR